MTLFSPSWWDSLLGFFTFKRRCSACGKRTGGFNRYGDGKIVCLSCVHKENE